MADDALTLVAVYQRTVRAGLARVWENVLDWEHLPWLHRASFLDVRLIEQTAESWRARVTLPFAGAPREAVIDVRLDRPHLRYLTRTVDGFGAGSEILTRLDPVEPHVTHISVEFRLPGIEPTGAEAVGAAYTHLYARLWDEDEGMMVRRQALLDATARPWNGDTTPVALGPVEALRRRLPLLIEAAGQPLRVMEVDNELLVHPTTCPHLGGPLEDAAVEDGCITCPWHGYRFDIRSGKNVDGHACRLDPAPRVRIDPQTGHALMVWP